MSLIGRNDPCPCGSGKKYKKCCMNTHEILKNIPWPTFEENNVINDLFKDPQFKLYYTNERSKIIKPIYWALDSSLPEGIDCRSTTLLPGEVQVIRLRRIPALIEDAMKIAHELQHLIMRTEGFVCTRAIPQFETLSSALNSMLQDIIVDTRLKNYGFNLDEDYSKETTESIRQLSNINNAPVEHLNRVYWILNCVDKMLHAELVNNNTFIEWFGAKYPDIYEESKLLLNMVNSIGYNTPEKQTHLFKEIIVKYNLNNYILL